MPRIALPEREEMSPAQRRVHDAVLAGPRGAVIGPLRAVIHSPDLAERWSRLGEFLRFDTVLPKRLNELAIIVTGRRWTSQIEWWVHARAAAEAGLPQAAIEAIRLGEPPPLEEAEDAEIYEFTRQLQQTGQVPLPAYRAVERRWGERGVVELTAVIGYYTMVSMTLNAHEIPLPEGVEPPLRPPPQAAGGLSPLPPARGAKGE
ncbi:carboxymuconolactone decarboxylase family protein [Roseomonas sp. E05]|uniref:carboxymuconolactone decarboxylase family protein n=1 Tax=Roseomonas sp. E05 TaxID=3046310 RepID=UPI0024B8F302|nr:carboxymuconolactone decarboxylase family protein [Roseomonas sp. E05]MDJ0389564.1 carboxymuconolactone decarboxylase family protein [Roseomonas sp. E05]